MKVGYRNESELKVHMIRGARPMRMKVVNRTGRFLPNTWAACWREAVNLQLTNRWDEVTCKLCLELKQ